MIPIIIISHDNHKYVDNTIKQLKNINEEYVNQIIILDNKSTNTDTIKYLNDAKLNVIWNNSNVSSRLSLIENTHIYNKLPDLFALTEPDLQYNSNIPKNFVEILGNLTEIYKCHRVGLALDISDINKTYNELCQSKLDIIYSLEKTYWNKKIDNTNYILYKAPIDTTFCVINKKYNKKNEDISPTSIRIAGNFTAKCIPYYNKYEIHDNDEKTINIINSKYLIIQKNNIKILIENNPNDNNLNFWKNKFSNWKPYIFTMFDKYLNKNNILIDIGGWIGPTCIYGSHLAKHVYVIEEDTLSFVNLLKNCEINCDNITLINKSIYINNSTVSFENKLKDSILQIHEFNDENSPKIQTITIKNLIKQYNIKNIGLIKIDIKGCEENVINDLYELYKQGIPIYLLMHYSLWKNKNLPDFFNEEQKSHIINNPFCSILFDKEIIIYVKENLNPILKEKQSFKNITQRIINTNRVFKIR